MISGSLPKKYISKYGIYLKENIGGRRFKSMF